MSAGEDNVRQVNKQRQVNTVDREIFTLKIICVINFRVDKCSQFHSIIEIFCVNCFIRVLFQPQNYFNSEIFPIYGKQQQHTGWAFSGIAVSKGCPIYTRRRHHSQTTNPGGLWEDPIGSEGAVAFADIP